MPKTKTGKKIARVLKDKPRREFEIEGELSLSWNDGFATFLIDDCYLSEFIQRHFHVKSEDARASFGRVKVLIIPVNE